MHDPAKSLRGVLIASMMGIIGAGCFGTGTTTGGSSASLVSTCDQICSNVVAQCTSAPLSVYNDCISGCGALNIVPDSCLDPFASYLACIAGATSVTCGAGGQYVLITPPQCEADRQATLSCNAAPGLIAGCLALPGNTSCGATGQTASTGAYFCVGAPAGCTAPQPNPLGIGVYCC